MEIETRRSLCVYRGRRDMMVAIERPVGRFNFAILRSLWGRKSSALRFYRRWFDI
jgi:hypothetical protein